MKKQRAIGDMSGNQRLAVAEDFIEHIREHAVAAYHLAASYVLTLVQDHLDAVIFFFQAEDGIRDFHVTGVQDVCSSDLAVAELVARVAEQLPHRDGLSLAARLRQARVSKLWIELEGRVARFSVFLDENV